MKKQTNYISNSFRKAIKTIKEIYLAIKKVSIAIKNIVFNLSKVIINSQLFKAFKSTIIKNKFMLVVVLIVTIFISKNVLTIASYNVKITNLTKELNQVTGEKKDLEAKLEYYKTDRFIFQYAVEELNMRPTQKSKLHNLEIKEINEDLLTDEEREALGLKKESSEDSENN